MKNEKEVNKDLILREKLAIERTDMAIDRTLLSFVRTSLYFIVAGLTVNNILNISYGRWIEIFFLASGLMILIVGIAKYNRQKRKLKEAEKHIGNYKLEWDDEFN